MSIKRENGGWRAKIIADSISEVGYRITTMEVRFPRIVLAEFNTHRMFSRNSASSRAIPVERMIKMVEDDPFVPTYWGKNQKGMQASEELTGRDRDKAIDEWLFARDYAIDSVEQLMKYNVHKQLANRLLEPFMWHTCIVTATEWSNFFALRCAEAAAPEIRNSALLMREIYNLSEPQLIKVGEWHLPYVTEQDRQDFPEHVIDLIKLSGARCARVSYLSQDGVRDPIADIRLWDRLYAGPHLSPMEHPATPVDEGAMLWEGNLRGWKPYRKFVKNEHDASLPQG